MSEKKVPSTKVGGDVNPLTIAAGVGAIAVGVTGVVVAGYKACVKQTRKLLKERDRQNAKLMKGWKLYYQDKTRKKGP